MDAAILQFPRTGELATPAETADYLRAMAGDLAGVARRAGLAGVAELFDMAQLGACEVVVEALGRGEIVRTTGPQAVRADDPDPHGAADRRPRAKRSTRTPSRRAR